MIYESSWAGAHPSWGARHARVFGREGGYPAITSPVLLVLLSVCCLALGSTGCGALGAGFVDILEPSGALATIENAPGHVVITFVNNAVVDERLIAHLEGPGGGGLVLSDAEKRALRPRVRLRLRVSFTDGTSRVIEFIDGSPELVDPRFDVQAFPDLNENDLTNAVVLCDVSAVEIDPGTGIEVFIPVELQEYEWVVARETGGVLVGVGTWLLRQQILPQFRPLLIDELDEDGNVTLLRNIGIQDVPSPVDDPLCGSVISLVVNGVLAVPFLGAATDVPAYGIGDLAAIGSIGGRYEFIVSVH